MICSAVCWYGGGWSLKNYLVYKRSVLINVLSWIIALFCILWINGVFCRNATVVCTLWHCDCWQKCNDATTMVYLPSYTCRCSFVRLFVYNNFGPMWFLRFLIYVGHIYSLWSTKYSIPTVFILVIGLFLLVIGLKISHIILYDTSIVDKNFTRIFVRYIYGRK